MDDGHVDDGHNPETGSGNGDNCSGNGDNCSAAPENREGSESVAWVPPGKTVVRSEEKDDDSGPGGECGNGAADVAESENMSSLDCGELDSGECRNAADGLNARDLGYEHGGETDVWEEKDAEKMTGWKKRTERLKHCEVCFGSEPGQEKSLKLKRMENDDGQT